MAISTTKYLTELADRLVKGKRLPIGLTSGWAKQFPAEAGVYILFDGSALVYAGETSSIKERMRDYLDTRHHTVRRKIGLFNFSGVAGFKMASSKKRFPAHIEKMVENRLKNEIKICFLVIELGRKELEEFIINKFKPRYNSKGRRGAKLAQAISIS
jgi:hypothetical protein